MCNMKAQRAAAGMVPAGLCTGVCTGVRARRPDGWGRGAAQTKGGHLSAAPRDAS